MNIKYVIDSCSLIELKDTYRQTVFPDAWKNIITYLQELKIASSYFVYEELKAQEGDIIFKLVDRYPDIFIPPTKEIQMEVKKILQSFPNLIKVQSRKSGADPFVIATAIIYNVPIITEEKKTGDINSPHIPDVCDSIKHSCIKLVEFFETEGFSFINSA